MELCNFKLREFYFWVFRRMIEKEVRHKASTKKAEGNHMREARGVQGSSGEMPKACTRQAQGKPKAGPKHVQSDHMAPKVS